MKTRHISVDYVTMFVIRDAPVSRPSLKRVKWSFRCISLNACCRIASTGLQLLFEALSNGIRVETNNKNVDL